MTANSNGSYVAAGVDIDAGEALVERIKPFAKATARAGAAAALGGFGGLFDLKAAGFSDPILVASNDGVGTKLKIAIETGLHDTIGIDLVAMCANDVAVQGAQPLFFLDYFACGKLDVDAAARVVKGIAEGCRQAGAALIGGETAEMPGMYAQDDYDLAGFCVGAAERGSLLPREDIAEGDVVLGVASSGVHSNGFSLVRKIVRDSGLSWKAPAPFEPSRSLGEALLDPTRIYVKAGACRPSDGAREGVRAYHRRRPAGKRASRAASRCANQHRPGRPSLPAGLPLAGQGRECGRGRNAAHLQLRRRLRGRRRAPRRDSHRCVLSRPWREGISQSASSRGAETMTPAVRFSGKLGASA